MEKRKLEELIERRYSIRDIAKECEHSYTSVRYWLKKYNLNTLGENKAYKNNWDEQNIKNAIISAESKSDILKSLGIKLFSGNYQTLDRYIKKFKIEVPEFSRTKNKKKKVSQGS